MEHVVAKLLDPPERRSTGRSEEVVEDVLANPGLFAPVFAAMSDEEPVVRMRAADAVEKITRVRPELLASHLAALLELTATVEQKDVRWHLAQLLGRVPLSASERPRAVAVLLDYLADPSSIVKTMALQALADLAEDDAALGARVIPLLEQAAASGTPAMRARARHLLARDAARTIRG